MNIELPTKAEMKADIQKNGADAFESLALVNEKDLLKWIDTGEVSEDAYSWWDNAQEEMRCMMAEFC